MTAPARPPAPVALAEGWTVTIDMPVRDFGRRADQGKPVGWLTLNRPPVSVRDKIDKDRIGDAWQRAAYRALERRRIPRDLGRIYLTVQYRFTERHGQEPSNFESTLKHVIDALRPTKTRVQKTRVSQGRGRPPLWVPKQVVEAGWGVIVDDKPEYLVRGPELPPGPYLGRNSPVKGQIILHIQPFPPEEHA